MTSQEQMELMIKIRAQGQDAAAQLKRIEDRMSGIKSAGSGMAGGARAAFEGLTKGAHAAARGLGVVLAPLGWMAKGAGVAGAAAAAFGAVAVSASGNMETLKLRLDGVTASAEESARIFEDVKRLGVASPFSDTQMADAAIALRQFAMYSKQNLQTVSDAATVTQRDMQDVVMAIVGMEAEPLRRLGIQFSAAGGNFVATYRTKLGEVKTATAKTRDEASQMLLDIFKQRFGGAAGGFATSWKGVTSTFSGAMEQALSRLGDGTRKRLAGMLGEMNEALSKLIDSGTLDEIGEKIGAGVETAVDNVRAAFETVSQLSKAGGFSTMLMEGAAGAAEVMGRGFIEYLKAGYGTIAGLFRAAFAVVLQEYRNSDLLGAKSARSKYALQRLETMTPEEAERFGVPKHLAGKKLGPMDFADGATPELLKFSRQAAETRAPWLSDAANADATRMFEGGISQTGAALKGAVTNMRDIVRDVAEKRTANIVERTGYDPAAFFQGNLDRIRQERADRATEEANSMTVQRVRGRLPRRDNAGNDTSVERTIVETAKQGQYTRGQQLPSGYVVVQVEQLNVRANSPQELSEKILALCASPVATAGAY
ncbi:MAG: hypothetical protein PHR35_05890 [Kiritimatiellae bacterium]|nr:hypothetical protein [Kiritimatiellia bacterium]